MGIASTISILLVVLLSFLAIRYINNTSMESRRTVIVVGGGLAGLSAALEAQKHGARVYVLEKEVRLGGNSAKASSGMNAVGTPAQHASHSQDTPAAFVDDTLASGGGACVRELVDTIVAHSAEAVAFLTEYGVDLSVLSKCGGHSHARTHRAKPPSAGQLARNIGFEITSKLIDHVNKYSPPHPLPPKKTSISSSPLHPFSLTD
jgi:succinate dehydrogenase/fumarate reductase flavoprotein subunit